MKVKELTNKIRLIDTKVEIKENFKLLTTLKTPIKESEYLERTVNSFDVIGEKQLIIHIKPIN